MFFWSRSAPPPLSTNALFETVMESRDPSRASPGAMYFAIRSDYNNQCFFGRVARPPLSTNALFETVMENRDPSRASLGAMYFAIRSDYNNQGFCGRVARPPFVHERFVWNRYGKLRP